MTRLPNLTALPLVLALAACGGGGGGGGIASTPAPLPAQQPTVVRTEEANRTPLASNPAWTSGTYSAVALSDSSGDGSPDTKAPDGSVSIAIDTTAKTYALTVNTGLLHVAPARLDSPSGMGTKYQTVQVMSDGTRTTNIGFLYETEAGVSGEVKPDDKNKIEVSLGLSGTYVSGDSSTPINRHTALGRWSLAGAQLGADGVFHSTDQSSSGYFAFGDRTAAGDIPTTGTASYRITYDYGDSLGCDSPCPDTIGTTKLSVDFAARMISAAYAWASSYDFTSGAPGNPAPGTYFVSADAAGSSHISNDGAFNILLAGTGLVRTERLDKTAVPNVSVPVTGLLAGALFGPQASEMGGVYKMPVVAGPDASITYWNGAFSAVKSAP